MNMAGIPKNETSKPKVGKPLPPIDIGWLDIRVVNLTNVQFHPKDDRYYLIQADIGDRFLKVMINKLTKYVRPTKLRKLERRFIAVCNINFYCKAGITASGRLLVASVRGGRELLEAPWDCETGDIVTVAGYPRNLYDPIAVLHQFEEPVKPPIRRLFAAVAPDLRVNSDHIAVYKDIPLEVEGKGYIKTKVLADCPIR